MKQLIYNSSFFVILFIALAGITYIACDWMKKSAAGQAFIKIDGDGKDYYSYLTSAFITYDLTGLKTEGDFVVETPTGTIKMHPAGVALMQLPFFGMGYLAAYLSGRELSGFSTPFQLAISLAALVYALIGLWFIYKLLGDLGFQKPHIFWSLLCVFFGTTLLNYTLTEPSMSHVYSFALVSGFLYHIRKLSGQFSSGRIYILALLLGLIILVRPVNVIVLFLVPFFYNSFGDFKQQLKNLFANKKLFAGAVLLTALVISVQCLIWFMQTGQFFQHGYKGNGFYFLHPQLLPMLFGFNSGILPYTPLFLLMFPALVLIYKHHPYKAYSLALFLLFALYLFSAYWGWTYFDGIGTRTIVDFYAIAAIGLCYVFKALASVPQKWLVRSFAVVCVLFNLIICYQYKEGIIQGSGMNFEKYAYTFLETSPEYKQVLGGCYDLQPYSSKPKQPFINYKNDFNKERIGFYNYGGKEYGVEFKSDQLHIDSRKIHVKISLDRLELKKNTMNEVYMAVALNDSSNVCKVWQTFRLNDTPSAMNYSNWKHYDYSVNVASTIHDTDQLAVFVWNKEKQAFGIDNFKIELYDYGNIN